MRTQRRNSRKRCIRRKPIKKKSANNLNLGCTLNNGVAIRNRKHINKAIQIRLLPKDSCEVYKARRKRELDNKRRKSSPQNSSTDRKSDRRVSRKDQSDGFMDRRKNEKKNKPHRVSHRSTDSTESYTASETSLTSYASSSDMESK